MSNDRQHNDKDRRERLRAVVAAYGADRAAWPLEDREEFSGGDLEDEGVALPVSEARALDAVLARASMPQPATGAAARIAARIAAADDTVVQLDHRGRTVTGQGPLIRASHWRIAGLMAASLLVGIFLGQSDIWSDTLGGPFLSVDATLNELGDMIVGLPLDPNSFAEDTL